MKLSKTFEKNLDAYRAKYRYIINKGGTRCFAPKQHIWTNKGNKPICEIEKGDIVKSYNEHTKKIELKPVIDVFKSVNEKKMLRVKLKNGDVIEASEDHKFYFEGGWHSLKHILSLFDEMEKNTRL